MRTATAVLTLVVLSTTLLTGNLIKAQNATNTSQPQNNPLDLFNFRADNLLTFLWDSLKSEYRTNVQNELFGLNSPGNISDYLQNAILQASNNSEMARTALRSQTVQKLLELVDADARDFISNLDLTNINLTEIQSQLVVQFNLTQYAQALMRPVLFDLQNMDTFENITAKVDSVLEKLERGDDIFPELKEELSSLINIATGSDTQMLNNFAISLALGEPLKELSSALQNTVQTLKLGSDWANMSNGEKLLSIVMEFNYQSYGQQALRIVLQITQDSLPAHEIPMLRDFLVDLETLSISKVLGVKGAFAVYIPIIYDAVKAQLAAMNSTISLPDQFPFDLDQLEDVGFYSAIETGLYDAMKDVMRENTFFNTSWPDRSGVSDMERFYVVLTHVSFSGIGQNIMGHILDTISQESELRPMLYKRVNSVLSMIASQANMTSSDTLANSTAEALVKSLTDSYNTAVLTANWTVMENSQKLAQVLTESANPILGFRVFFAVISEAEDRLSSTQLSNIAEVQTLIENQDLTALKQRLKSASDQFVMSTWNMTVPAQLTANNTVVLGEIAEQLIKSYQKILAGQNNMTRESLEANQQNFTDLSPFKKMMYTCVSVEFRVIGELIIEELERILESRVDDLLTKVSNQQSIKQDISDFIKQLRNMLSLPIGDEILQSSVADVLLDNVNSQFYDMYQNFSQSMVWQANNYSSTMKLMNLMMAFDYADAGYKMLWESLKVGDSQLSPNLLAVINKMIQNVGNQQSIGFQLERLRDMLGGYQQLQMLSNIPVDALRPIYDEIDRQISSLDQTTLNDWKAIPGSLQKVASLINNLNTTTLGQAALSAAGRMAENMIITQISNNLPANITDMISGYMLSLESGGMNNMTVVLNQAVNMVVGSNTMLKPLLNNAIVMDVGKSLMSSINDAYKAAELSSGAEWRSMDASEKFMRIFREIDLAATLQTAATIGSTTLNGTMDYYTTILNPTLSANCSADLAQMMAALPKATSFDPKYSWALDMVDAWGKPPAGFVRGRFKWPGEMLECIRIKANRTTTKPDGTIITEVDGIKGAWSMVAIKLGFLFPGEAGAALGMTPGGEPLLELGVCMPDTCTYQDINSTISRVQAIGSGISWVKRRADYPNINGTWKTDPKFIGVTVFFAILISVIILCTVMDKCMMMKAEKCADEKAEKDVNEKGEKYVLPQLNGGNDVQMVESEIYSGGEKVAFDNKAYENNNGDLEGAKTNGHAHGADAADFPPPPPKSPPPKAKMSVGMQLMKSFSLYETLPKMMDSSPKPNQLQGLDGIRFLSMSWVILGHVYAFPMYYGVQNLRDAADFGSAGDWTFQGIAAGLYAVDSFFLLSGLLVGYLFLKTLSKIKKKDLCFTLVMYYVHRYIRLLPLYGGIILITVAYQNYIGFGPFNNWFDGEYITNPCDKNWWTNLLYINNFVNNGGTEMCNGVSWYLANDMQFYWIAPLFLLPLYWVPKLGITLILAAFAACLGVTGWQWGERDGGSQFSDQKIFEITYIKPWTRIGPYLIGLLLAYILFKKFTVKCKWFRAIWWLISLGGIALCVYIPHDATAAGVTTSSWNNIQRAVYESLCKSGWAICLGWIVFACNTNSKGPIGEVLNWSGWAPLSKLTYAAYLIHPIVMEVYYKNMFQLVYLEHFNLMVQNIAFVVLSYAVGAVLHLVLEAPMLGLEKLILPRRR